MKTSAKSIIIILVQLLFCTSLYSQKEKLFFSAAGSPATPKVQVNWNRYNSYAGITDIVKKLADAYPDLVTLSSLGKSYKGRELWIMTISDKKTGDPDHKPGFWIDGNIHSSEVQGTEMALYTAWYLCEMSGENEFIRELLRDKVFYITPTINPDGRELFLDQGIPNRSGVMPYDNDRDGLFDEDGPDDMNGDGNISQIRRLSPDGMYKTDPRDPRRMIRVDPGEKGEYELLGMEGIDNDGDGLVNEDGPGGYDGNRDWGFNWEPNYIQSGADKYPFAQPENQAIRDFIINHRNITGAQSFHNTGGLILRGPSIQGGGAEIYSRSDDAVMNEIGKKGQEMIAGYKFVTVWKDMYTVYGGELDWWYGAMGCFVFSNELWNSYLMFYDTANTDQFEFDRLLLFGEGFVPWQKMKHPVYGDVEVGGFSRMFGRAHPGFMLETDAHRNASFCIYNAYQSPKLEISNLKVKKLGGGLTEVTARVSNRRLIPTHSADNISYRIDPPDYVYLDGATVLAGMVVQNADLNITSEQKNNPQRMELSNIAGYQDVDLKWIVKGGGKITVRVESVKGGRASATTE